MIDFQKIRNIYRVDFCLLMGPVFILCFFFRKKKKDNHHKTLHPKKRTLDLIDTEVKN